MAQPTSTKQELEKKLKAYAGVEIGPPQVALDAVNEAMIRHWCDAMGDRNPVYTDAAAAQRSAHGGIVAPPTMLQAWCLRGLEMASPATMQRNKQTELHQLLTDHGYPSVVATNCEQGYVRYLRPGDRISTTTVIESISEEKATALGIGYFINTRDVFRDQDGKEVGWMTFRVLKFIPQQRREAAEAAPAAAKPQRIRPPLGHDNGWWWQLVEQGVLPIQKCNGCGRLHHPPRPMCDRCRGTDMGHVAASGRGTVHTFTVIHHPQFPGYEFPIVAALIDLEEGTRMVSNVVECPPSDVHVGMAVQGFVQQGEDGMKLPVFRPVR
jgi:uncharacterized OB-fold protein/acyl dehydratase